MEAIFFWVLLIVLMLIQLVPNFQGRDTEQTRVQQGQKLTTSKINNHKWATMCKNVFLLQLWVVHQFPDWVHLAFQLYYHLHQYTCTYQM